MPPPSNVMASNRGVCVAEVCSVGVRAVVAKVVCMPSALCPMQFVYAEARSLSPLKEKRRQQAEPCERLFCCHAPLPYAVRGYGDVVPENCYAIVFMKS